MLRIIYYQTHANHPSAIMRTLTNIKTKVARKKAEILINRGLQNSDLRETTSRQGAKSLSKEIRRKLYINLYSDNGQELLRKFYQIYEDQFKTLNVMSKKINSRLLVLYLPSDYFKKSLIRDVCRNFFRDICKKYNVDYLDLTEELFKYPFDWFTLLPENSHLARFGNKIIVKKLSEYLNKYSKYRSNVRYDSHPDLLGDLNPSEDRVFEINSTLTFRHITNNQGLRMEYDLKFPKPKQRIIILGDSFTYGPYLDNQHCYPNMLDKKYPDKEVINAGISGYTIIDEVSLFDEKAKFVEPDIIILQVLDNDITDLFYFQRNRFDRKRHIYSPIREEIDFINKVLKIH